MRGDTVVAGQERIKVNKGSNVGKVRGTTTV
jgi:hypothetical protein